MNILGERLEIFSRIRGVRSGLFSVRFVWRKTTGRQVCDASRSTGPLAHPRSDDPPRAAMDSRED